MCNLTKMKSRALLDRLTRLEKCVLDIARANVAVDVTVLTFNVVRARRWIEDDADVHKSMEPWVRPNLVRTVDGLNPSWDA